MQWHQRVMYLFRVMTVGAVILPFAGAASFEVPAVLPSSVVAVDAALLGVSIEFFAFPGYMDMGSTGNCLGYIGELRGNPPPVRIGGTTQDRASFDALLPNAVNYTVADPADAPETLTFGPLFFDLANSLPGDVTLGLNRELNNISNTRDAARQAVEFMSNLFAVELGNEPDLYPSNSPIADGSWSSAADGASQKEWFDDISSVVENVFQAAVYISFPGWSTANLIPLLGDSLSHVKTFSDHSYPQSACNGATTDLEDLMSHSSIVNYVKQFAPEGSAAHDNEKSFFFGETNSATCGGGGISPTFGAALWVIDYTLQAVLNNVDRLYFHQGTIGNCAYCFWGADEVFSPFYGAAFVSEFLGNASNPQLLELDDGTSTIAAYATYSDGSNGPDRILLINSALYDGTNVRQVTNITLSGLSSVSSTVQAKRLTAPNATSENGVTIGGVVFDGSCGLTVPANGEIVEVLDGSVTLRVSDSEALIVYL